MVSRIKKGASNLSANLIRIVKGKMNCIKNKEPTKKKYENGSVKVMRRRCFKG